MEDPPPDRQETPEHFALIEEEMEEIRARMAPDVRDLKAHLDPGARGAKAGRNIRERLRSFIRRD